MLGLVNQGIHDLALQLGGEQLWRDITAAAGVPTEDFLGMGIYPDELTYQLVDATGSVLGISRSAVLEAFGQHWILYTARRGYGPIFDTMGRSLPEFLTNLDAMHTRLSLTMPDLRPPSFVCDELSDHQLRLEYWSDRPGLAPMIFGLLTGLGELFGLGLSVVQTRDKTTGSTHDEFLIDHWPLAAAVTVATGNERVPPAGSRPAVAVLDA